MVKIYNCPFCSQSARIIDSFEEEESSFKVANDEKLIKITWYKNYKMKCTSCKRVYNAKDKREYTYYKEGLPLTSNNDVALIAEFNEESRLESLFKIIEIKSENKKCLLVLYGVDEYPILLDNENLLKEPQKIRSLVYDTYKNRYF